MRTYISFVLLSFLLVFFNNCSLPADDEEEEKLEKNDYSFELPWSGEIDKFNISAEEGICLNDPQETAATAYLTIPSNTVRNTRWEFGVRLTFNPSANNYARFYLSSSSNILSGALDGYFIQIGGTKDDVSLYKQNESQPQLLASGRELMKDNKSPKLFVKVECDNNGYWTFWTRLESESEYTKEKQVKETQHTSSSHCGIYCVYTKSRCDGFRFHHIQISNDVETTTQPDDTPEEPETPETPELPEDVRRMLLFNEVMYDNADDGAEYIEIYNPTAQTISAPALYLYKMKSNGEVFATTVLQHEDSSQLLSIPSESYLCFTKSISKLVQKHKVSKDNLIEIAKFPLLSNGGGYLALSSTEKPSKEHTFDKCIFRDTMHDTSQKKTMGISLEKKAPDMPSINLNWRSSVNLTGGTPGIENQ